VIFPRGSWENPALTRKSPCLVACLEQRIDVRSHRQDATRCLALPIYHLNHAGCTSIVAQEHMRPLERNTSPGLIPSCAMIVAQSRHGCGQALRYEASSSSLRTRSRCTSPFASSTFTGRSISCHLKARFRARRSVRSPRLIPDGERCRNSAA
jgi:hypothetical protein